MVSGASMISWPMTHYFLPEWLSWNETGHAWCLECMQCMYMSVKTRDVVCSHCVDSASYIMVH